MDTLTLSPEVRAATEALAVNLRQSESVVLYHLAHETLEADPQARALLERFSAAQADLRAKQSRGAVTSADVEHLRALQREVQVNRTIMEYAETQQLAIAYLRETNQEISQLIGMDFGSLAKRPGCC